ncbi:MAG TPA: beta-galactosidase GalB [Bacteroidales bacterium]|nr:beta-galactosidase GalB [Bacteroidales bacterium]
MMKTKQLLSIAIYLILSGMTVFSSEKTSFNKGWKFINKDTIASAINFDDSRWRTLNLPHDWSVEGTFDEKNPSTPGGGALPGGIGWYRKTFTIEKADSGKLFFIDFDGVYRNSEVWINGQYLGKRPNGYISFRYELTPYLHYGNTPNVIAVKVDNSKQPNSRWYSGSGIYRNVWIIKSEKIRVDHWGTFIKTLKDSAGIAIIELDIKIKNTSGKSAQLTVKSEIIDQKGIVVDNRKSKILSPNNAISGTKQLFEIEKPNLWSVENPYLYKVVTTVISGKKVLDTYETPLGIRTFTFDANKGFLLNGKKVKINGVCNHHDLGCLGAAINVRALERQLEILKSMGVNGIRTSHNPPAPELLDLCDKMGFIVMDEAFDMWKKKKTEFDYSLDWDVWHKQDLEDFVLRDRNHPSVFIWSIGNEILEQWDSTGITIGKELATIVRSLDATRPITSALNDPNPNNYIYQSGSLDLVGFNYHHQDFANFPKNFPNQKFIATETVSALATRGSYDMPADTIKRWPQAWDKPLVGGNKDFSCSSYDNCSAPWGSTHEETWKIMKKNDFLSGQYIWTGFDYIGEPTPYPWPARSSYFGIVDIAGFPKNAFYLYQSEWTSKPVLHIFPHWNWKAGDTIDVWAYSSFRTVELFLNGKSVGKKTKGTDDLHLSWRVPFEAGTLKAIGYIGEKAEMATEVKTAGEPAKIILEADRQTIKADGSDLSFVTVKVVDKDGVVVPYADNQIQFSISGEGTIVGTDNGSQISMEPFKSSSRKAFHGLCLAVVQSTEKQGQITLKATADKLPQAEIIIQSK